MSQNTRDDEGVEDGRKALRDLFRRTWEMELLISGAVLYALLQGSAPLDRLFVLWDAVGGRTTFLGGFFLYYYAKLILYVLISAFTGHLVVRAVWIGMLGLHSVFPGGVVWDDLRQGPNVKANLRTRMPSMGGLIRTTDAVASVIFALAFSMVGIFVWSVAAVGLFAGLTWALARVTGIEGSHLFWTLFLLFNLFLAAPALLDRALGSRINPESGMARWIRRSARRAWYLGGQVLYVPVFATLSTNLKGRWAGAVFPVALTLLLGFFIVRDVMLPSGGMRVDGGRFFPDRAESGLLVDPAFYEDRPVSELVRLELPTIPAEIIPDPLVRLFLPYRIRGDDDVLAERCPAGAELRSDTPRLLREVDEPIESGPARAALGCLSSLYEVHLDGVPVSLEQARFARRDPTGQPGLALYLDLRGAPVGAHELTVRRLEEVVPEEERDAPVKPGQVAPNDHGEVWLTYSIPFWN